LGSFTLRSPGVLKGLMTAFDLVANVDETEVTPAPVSNIADPSASFDKNDNLDKP
jgi:hypothetical protein